MSAPVVEGLSHLTLTVRDLGRDASFLFELHSGTLAQHLARYREGES